jgi:hypothetical protein
MDAVIIFEERLPEALLYRVCEKSGPGSVLRPFILDLRSKQPKQVIQGDERYPKDMLVGHVNVLAADKKQPGGEVGEPLSQSMQWLNTLLMDVLS